MVYLSLYNIIEILVGAFFLWVGVYFVSRNTGSSLSWIIFGLLASMGIVTGTDPFYANIASIQGYLFWQKVFDFPLFLIPILCYHATILIGPTKKIISKFLGFGYVLMLIFYILDFTTDYIVNSQVIRIEDLKFNFVFAPGILFLPLMVIITILFSISLYNLFVSRKYTEDKIKFNLPIIGMMFYAITSILVMISYYIFIPMASVCLTVGLVIGAIMITYSIIRYHLFASNEKIIFDKNFIYQSIVIMIIVGLYIVGFVISGTTLTFATFSYLNIMVILLLFTHSFYDWFTTFINDLVFNPSAGFSVVNDEEINNAIKNYNTPERLEGSSLLRLKMVNSKKNNQITQVDALRLVIKEAINYFKPDEDAHRRTKKNLKYHLLKMITFDEAEEGQILWELGFDEYPTSLRNGGTEKRKPIFARFYPSDYTYTSRNAYLALRKEAIHDIAWRISYLEKQTRRNLF